MKEIDDLNEILRQIVSGPRVDELDVLKEAHERLSKYTSQVDESTAIVIESLMKEIEKIFTEVSVIKEAVGNLKLQKGDKGDSYILTSKDKKEIAKSIDVPIIEKVIEKHTEVIKEQPIITEVTKEVKIQEIPEEVIEDIEILKDGFEKLKKDSNGRRNAPVVGTSGLRVYVDSAKKGLLKEVNFKAGTGVTLSHSQINGLDAVTFNATAAATTWVSETPTGVIDGVNTTYTLSQTPTANSLLLFLNGQYQTEGSEYTLSGSTITFAVAPAIEFAGLPFIAKYQ